MVLIIIVVESSFADSLVHRLGRRRVNLSGRCTSWPRGKPATACSGSERVRETPLGLKARLTTNGRPSSTESPMELVAGINGKNLRLLDLRAADKNQQQGPSTHATRAVYGVCVDPRMDHRVASYYDNQVTRLSGAFHLASLI